ncbi:hypothetical protein ABBQ32_013811 [Trebouxia sp. C0010 RCD-2024]
MVDKSAFTVTKVRCLPSGRLSVLVPQGGNTAVIKKQVQQQFKRNACERDPTKIAEQKDAAIRGLSNYMFMEAQRMAKEGAGGSPADKFDG